MDLSEFRKILPEELPARFPELNSDLEQEIRKFGEWMENRRYAESTVKTYRQSLSLFFRFMGNKNPEEITIEDLEKFIKIIFLRENTQLPFNLR
ncbi:phage integrase N-terminal SAM-like domain-containing protein [Algoriphagus mannitolivorans]|uniref:phage integrase N-terminal SAM-like domain-containing protein n=1 Tax=Algoriphagus mannitolivorans TaxID=226504 RepID=UPI0004269D77|nr:phage integrase N-terminal SAM-like domain-containing protein [Algoriphagus mannitolivorans]